MAPVHFPGLPPEFMQAIVHQISHQAAAMAAAASAGHPEQMATGPGSTPGAEAAASQQPPHPAQARVVITRPSFSPRIPQPVGTRGTTINLRATVPTASQQPGQVRPAPAIVLLLLLTNQTETNDQLLVHLCEQGTPLAPSSLTQMISGLVGQLLMPGQPGQCPPASTVRAAHRINKSNFLFYCISFVVLLCFVHVYIVGAGVLFCLGLLTSPR